jgi:hypothetical protein
MPTDQLIPVDQFCVLHKIDFSFISSLREYGLIEVTGNEEEKFIPADQLRDLEKMVMLHYDMDINLEGIEVITYLLKRLNDTHDELVKLRNRLNLYEGDE